MKNAFFAILVCLFSVGAVCDESDSTIGDEGAVWKKVGDGFYVDTNGVYYTKSQDSYFGFRTSFVADLPKSSVVGAPQSSMSYIEGNCDDRTFHVMSTSLFSEKSRGGIMVHTFQPENFARKLTKGSLFEKAFNMLCKTAKVGDIN